MKRNIIIIDEEKCTGCGDCIVNCAEGSLEIINGKAVLVKESLCDGLGACIGHCPEGALHLEVREVDAYDEEQVEERLKEIGRPALKEHAPAAVPVFGGCPSANASTRVAEPMGSCCDASPSQLGQWPVQLTLVRPDAAYFKDSDLMMAADCVPFAYPDFHKDFLAGNTVVVACPKLDDAEAHYAKMVEVFKHSEIKSVTVLRMEVPCCGGLAGMTKKAIEQSGADIKFFEVMIGRDGTILEDSRAA